MGLVDLTDAERALFERLPKLQRDGHVSTTNVWIIEWLPARDRRTGRELHEWMESRRPGWSKYEACGSRAEVINAMGRATRFAQRGGIPMLHLEAHGDEHGLAGPDGKLGIEGLLWEDLRPHLQQLNLATACNLFVFFAACEGFAGILALNQGPRVPAVAMVGPDTSVLPGQLLECTKEFYRRLISEGEGLDFLDIAASASREMKGVTLEPERCALLWYETFVCHLIESLRPQVQAGRVARYRQQLVEAGLYSTEAEHRLQSFSGLPPTGDLQHMWDQMFMIDIWPANHERFGLNVDEVVRLRCPPLEPWTTTPQALPSTHSDS